FEGTEGQCVDASLAVLFPHISIPPRCPQERFDARVRRRIPRQSRKRRHNVGYRGFFAAIVRRIAAAGKPERSQHSRTRMIAEEPADSFPESSRNQRIRIRAENEIE